MTQVVFKEYGQIRSCTATVTFRFSKGSQKTNNRCQIYIAFGVSRVGKYEKDNNYPSSTLLFSCCFICMAKSHHKKLPSRN